MSVWRERRVLITGHTGFKGSWLALWLESRGAVVSGVGLDPEDGAGAFVAMGPWPGLDDRRIDLRDGAAVATVLAELRPEVVFHLGAQALVRRGYAEPLTTFDTNVMGTANVLAAAAALAQPPVVVVVTSDKVYRPASGRPYRESDPLGGEDPYSASKAAQELVVDAWRSSLDRVVTARAGNVIGGGDRGADRLVPDLVRAIEAGAPVHLRYPGATRPWQFVLDPLAGYVALAEALLAGEVVPPSLNFGPAAGPPTTVGELVSKLQGILGGPEVVVDTAPQPHEAPFLELDASAATAALGWRPQLDLEAALTWTGEWYQAQRAGEPMRERSLAQLEDFERLAAP